MAWGEYVIFFSNSGSEANETAFKIARQYYAQKVNHIVINLCHVTVGITGIQWRQWRDGTSARRYQYEPFASGFYVTPPDCYRMPEIEGRIFMM